MKVLCFGSLNIDYVYQVPHFVNAGETLASRDLQIFSGGKGLNQSIALARAGAETYHAGAIGTDGLFLLEELKAAGVNTDYIEQRHQIKTGHAIIQNSESGDNCILLYGGANHSITREQIDRTLADFAAGDALVVQNEINELAYLMEQAKQKGMLVALNPSPMDDRLPALIGYSDYLLLNEVEAAQLVAKDTPMNMLRQLQKQFPTTAIVLTVGAGGSLYADAHECLVQSAVRVQPVDTTAAGDTYTGFFLAGIFSGQSPKWTMAFASKAAAIAVTRKGAAPSIPTRDEIL